MSEHAAPDRAHWAWRPVVGFVLALVAWSIYTYLHHYLGVPKFLAFGGAAIFDLTALILGDLAHRAIKAGDIAAANVYRLAVALFVAGSSTVNWLHAQVAHWGLGGGLLFAAAPITAEVVFEAQHWHEHRQRLRAQGLLPDALPRLGLFSWLFFGRRSKGVVKNVVEARLEIVEITTARRVELARAAGQGSPGLPGHVPAETPGQLGVLPGARPVEALPPQTLRLEIATTPGDARPAATHLVPARAPRPAPLPEPALAAQAPDGQEAEPAELSIAQAVRIAIDEIGTDKKAVTDRAAELKPDAQRDSIRREASRQIDNIPGTGLYM